jgi:hypothetical protein
MLKRTIGVVCFSLIFGHIGWEVIKEQMAPIVYAREPEPPQEVLIRVQIDWTRSRIEKEIEEQAEKYGVSAELMRIIINCESQYKIDARGDSGHSRGLVQIHNEYHPHVTDEMANDPQFAIAFLAKNLSKGNGKWWSCHP